MPAEFIAFHADIVLASEIKRGAPAAVETQFTDLTDLVVLKAFAAFVAEEMLVVFRPFGAQVVRAVFLAFFAQMAVFAEVEQFEAFTAVVAEMFFPFCIVARADIMFTVIARSTVFAHTAVFALGIVRTIAAFRAEMFLIVRRKGAVAVCAAFFFAVLQAAFFAETAVRTDLFAVALSAFAALLADPLVILAAHDAVIAA